MDPHVLEPGHAPTPFTADEIRASTEVGDTLRSLVEVPGEEASYVVTRYLSCDADGATTERFREALDGSLLGDVARDEMTWLDLQRHTSFPAEDTTIELERTRSRSAYSTACATPSATATTRTRSGSRPPCPACRSASCDAWAARSS
jgi:hypothetical protein